MPYNEQIEDRIVALTSQWAGTASKKMFGGVCHLLQGHMFCGVYKDYLILRLGESVAGEVLASSHTRPFDITGKPMKGWVMVEQAGFGTTEKLARWLDQARDFVQSLPPKS